MVPALKNDIVESPAQNFQFFKFK